MQESVERALALSDANNLDSEIRSSIATHSSTSSNNEEIVWRKLICGDKQALGKLYDQYIDILFSYGMYHSKDRGYVMDCIHDLFLDLYKYRKNLSLTTNVKYYLIKSLKRKINKKYKTTDTPVSMKEFLFLLEGNSKNYAISCEEEIIKTEQASETNTNLKKALKTLTKKQRQVLFLRFNENRTYEDISAIMGISIETARTSIYRAIKTLRKLKFY